MDQRPNDTSYQYSTYNNNYPPNNFPPNYPPLPAKTNGKSIAALVLGILSIMIPYIGFILGIVAIILSTLSLKEIKRKNEQGKGLSIAGLVCGIIGTVLYGIIIAIVVILAIAYASDPYMYSNF